MKNFFSVLAPVLIAIQETWFLPTDPYNFNLFNYSLYRYDEVSGQRRHGGVALYVNNNFSHTQLDLRTDLQAVACTVYLNGRNVDICNVYLPPDSDIDQILPQLNGVIAQFQNPFILLGDFNAHSPSWWRGQQLNRRGQKVEDFISANNLVLLNKNQPTYFSTTHNIETAIDLSLCSPLLGTWFDWTIDGDIYDSDHYPILLQFTFQHDGVPSFIPRWKIDKANWNKFSQLCENIQIDEDDPEIAIYKLTDFIISAARSSIPLTKPCTRPTTVPWWSPHVKRAIAKRKQAFRSYLRHPSQHLLILRNKERANARRIIRGAKRASWQHFLSTLSSSTPLSQIWSIVRRLTGKRAQPSIPIIRHPGSRDSISDPQQAVNAIAQQIQQNSSNNNYSPDFLNTSQREFNTPPEAFRSFVEEDYNCSFSFQELQSAITSSGSTSVGPDQLHYDFFRHLPETTLLLILRTFNNLWNNRVFPDKWKESIVIALPKPGKIRSNPNNYRPIALTSCLGKIFERMVAKRLSYTFETRQLLSKYQCGFRPNHSPIDHLIRLETDIRKGFKNKQHTVAVFLDIKKAYDMIHKPTLIQKLHKLGIRGPMAYYLLNFLSGTRHFRVRCRSIHSDFHCLENGLPQGSCLSPLLFNVFIDDLFRDIPSGVRYSLFADDAALWHTDADCDTSIPRLQSSLFLLERWSKRNGLQFSAEKSAAMIFTRNTRTGPSRHLRICNNPIPYVNQFKFLGVVLDRNMSMARHVKYIKAKCSSRLNLFRCLTSSECGADRATLLRLYKAIVLPVIEYGVVMYAGGKEKILNSLETVQNSFLRVALGVMKTSPISAMQVEANVFPLYIRRKELSLRYYSKIVQYPDHAAHTAIHVLPRLHHNYLGPCERRTGLTIASRVKKYCNDIHFDIPQITPTPPLQAAPWKLHPRKLSFLFEGRKAELCLREIQQTFSLLRQQHHDFKFIYTDGSKEGCRTGNGIVMEGIPDLEGRLPDNTSVYIAELHAIFVALRVIQHYHIPQAYICSDSKSALTGLINPSFKEHLHFEIINLHHALTENGVNIKFLWIPGHSGILGNERADGCAKRALNLPNITNIATNYHSIRSSLRNSTTLFWERQWRADKRTQLHDIKTTIGSWSSSSRKTRLEEKVLARLRIGHTSLTHSFIFQRHERPLCNTCNTLLTVSHLLIHCRETERHRRPLLNYCTPRRIPFTLRSLLGDEHPELLHLLFAFLRNAAIIHSL